MNWTLNWLDDSSERANRIRELRTELEIAEESAETALEASNNAGVSDETRDFVRREFNRVPEIFGVLPVGGRRAVATEAAINPTGEDGSSISEAERARFGSAASADLVDNVAIALTAVTGPALVGRATQGGFTVVRGQAGREFLRRLPGTAAREVGSEAVEEGTFVAADFILTARAPDLSSVAEIGGEAGLETLASARRGRINISTGTVNGQLPTQAGVVTDPDSNATAITQINPQTNVPYTVIVEGTVVSVDGSPVVRNAQGQSVPAGGFDAGDSSGRDALATRAERRISPTVELSPFEGAAAPDSDGFDTSFDDSSSLAVRDPEAEFAARDPEGALASRRFRADPGGHHKR